MGIKVKLTLHPVKKKKKEEEREKKEQRQAVGKSIVFVLFLHDCIFSYKRYFWTTMRLW